MFSRERCRTGRVLCFLILVSAFIAVLYVIRHKSKAMAGSRKTQNGHHHYFAHHVHVNHTRQRIRNKTDTITKKVYRYGAGLVHKLRGSFAKEKSRKTPKKPAASHAKQRKRHKRIHHHFKYPIPKSVLHPGFFKYLQHKYRHKNRNRNTKNRFRYRKHRYPKRPRHRSSGYDVLFVKDTKEAELKRGDEYKIKPHPKVYHQTSTNVVFRDVAAENPFLQPGGAYKPEGRQPRGKVAIVIPYRNRWFHLRMLLHYIHPILQRQGMEYGIFIINQHGNNLFNKATLMNIGYLEVSKLDDYNCFVFHDVDLMPESYRCMYTCSSDPMQPRHISTGISKFKYRIAGGVTIGGVSSFSRDQFEAVNGWSNSFHGWGGEDDDMALRIKAKGMNIRRPSTAICRFTSLPHNRDVGNPLNRDRFKLLRSSARRMKTDGLNSMKYKVLAIRKYATYTNITVDFKNA